MAMLNGVSDISRFIPDSPSSLINLAAVLLAVLWLLTYLAGRARYYYYVRNLPYVHDVGRPSRWFRSRARHEFIGDFRALMRKGFGMNENAFRVQTDLGEVVVLSPRYAEEIRDDAGLSAGVYTNIELMGFIPGMEVFAFSGTHRALMHDVITKRLNRALRKFLCPLFGRTESENLHDCAIVAQLIAPLSNETAECLKLNWSDSKEWHSVSLYETMLATVARVSVSVFLGREMAQNQKWVDINTRYTSVGLGAVMALRRWPRFVLPIIHRFHPRVQETREVLAEARTVITTVLEKRRKETGDRLQDSLDWFDEVAAKRHETFDPAIAQLTFGVASIHSTSDELSQVLIDLRNQPEVIDAMRRELIKVVRGEGWTNTALSQLKLMDSVLKETQRLKPINRVFNKRAVLKDIKLSNGVHLPKGAFIAVSSDSTRDPELYDDPDQYDAYRYIKRAQTNPETARFCGFSSVSLGSTGFGFGKHACPGRNYVTLELKMLLAHIILKYDWRFPDGYEPQYMNNGFDSLTDVTASVLVKRREPEIAFPT